MLLNKDYNLNTLRVVNFGPYLGNAVYIYNLYCTVLYSFSSSSISLKRALGILPSSCKKFLDTGLPYLPPPPPPSSPWTVGVRGGWVIILFY